jgi:hypothetical protein
LKEGHETILHNMARKRPPYAVGVSEIKPERKPLDPPLTPFAIAGLMAFALVGLGLLAAHNWLVETGRENWLWICLSGFLWGIPGLLFMMAHDRGRKADK